MDSREAGDLSGRFDSTNWSAIRRGDLEHIVRRYWKPVYRFLRPRLSGPDAAEEATQEFFLRFIEKGVIRRLDPGKGRFRGFLFHLTRQFLIDHYRARSAAKRGGDLSPLPASEIEEPAESRSADPKEEFDRQWFLSLVNRVRRAVKAHFIAKGQESAYRAFRLFYFGGKEGGRWTQIRIAEELGISQDQVNNYLYRGRQVYAEALRSLVEEYAGAEGLEDELKDLARFLEGRGLEDSASWISTRPVGPSE